MAKRIMICSLNGYLQGEIITKPLDLWNFLVCDQILNYA
jgi:hypothetical protein